MKRRDFFKFLPALPVAAVAPLVASSAEVVIEGKTINGGGIKANAHQLTVQGCVFYCDPNHPALDVKKTPN